MSDATIEDVLAGTRRNAVLVGDCLDGLRSLPDGCVQACVTSPPYYGLRQYLPAGTMVLRDDLTADELAYVMAELRAAGVIE